MLIKQEKIQRTMTKNSIKLLSKMAKKLSETYGVFETLLRCIRTVFTSENKKNKF